VQITDVKYDFDWDAIEPGAYSITFSTKGYEYQVSTTRRIPEGTEVGLSFQREDIHAMRKGGAY